MVNVNCRVEKSSIVDKTTGLLEPEQRFEERYVVGVIKVEKNREEWNYTCPYVEPTSEGTKDIQ